jgi:glycerol-3-phosphate acyltransferase PlsY
MALLIPLVYYFLPSRFQGLLFLGGVTIIYLLIDYLRLKFNSVKTGFVILFGSLLRREELYSLSGGSYLLLAAIPCILLYDKSVFIAAISFLVIGDTVAALVGLSVGRVRFFKKTLEGTLAGLLACVGLAFFATRLGLPLKVGILGAVSAALIEALPFEVNDNVAIPIFSGAVMQLTKLIIH